MNDTTRIDWLEGLNDPSLHRDYETGLWGVGQMTGNVNDRRFEWLVPCEHATLREALAAGMPAHPQDAPPTDALTDRVNAWLSLAMTRAVIKPLEGTDTYTGTLPPFRKFAVVERSESQALAELRNRLENWARHVLLEGRELPTWESKVPELTPAAKSIVRLSNVRHELRVRGMAFGAERANLPAGAVERCVMDIDAVVTRHAMQMNGVTPPPANLEPSLTA